MMTLIDDLRGRVHGPVFVPNDDGYASECVGFNLASPQHPDVVVGATDTADIVAAVTFAGQAGMGVRVQATGHGVGDPMRGGLLVNTSRMTGATIDPEKGTATVTAGTKWREVTHAASKHGLAGLNGSTSDVGVIGFTLGGGFGPMARTFGFAADRVRRMLLVTADGSAIEVSPEREPELFWALRGGKCDIGIVTEMEFDLLPVEHFYGGGIFYPGENASAVLHAFRQWAPTLPETATTSVCLLRLPDMPGVPEPLRGRLSVHLRFVHIGDPAEGAMLVGAMREAAPALVDLIATTPYAEIDSVHQDPVDPMPGWDASHLLHSLPADAVDALLAIVGPDVESPLIMAEIRHLGGATRIAQGAPNAVGGRDAAYSLFVVGPYPPPLQAAVAAAGNAVIASMMPWSTGGTQINFQGAATEPESVRRAWPEDVVERLLAVKRQWDPGNRFHFPYSLVGELDGEALSA